MNDILKVENLKKYFPVTRGVLKRKVGDVKAVDDISFTLKAKETLGVVGESGCGKSTLGRTVLRLYDATSGKITFENQSVNDLSRSELRAMRKNMQMIFQDPYSSLPPRMTIFQAMREALDTHGIGTSFENKREITKELLHRVGINKNSLEKYPHEFSGGQRQRIGIARALSLNPKLIVCDEAVSALDVSIQSQVLNLLVELQEERDLSYIFISHDLSVVRHVSDRIMVMYLGKVVELTEADAIYQQPLHPYTRSLIASIPEPDPAKKFDANTLLKGELPSPMNPPTGCRFHTRCPHAKDICKTKEPELKNAPGETNHLVACHFTKEV